MPSTILLSDNGASSGSAGLKQTAGNDGVLILQTTTSGGTATNALYLDGSTYPNMSLGGSSLGSWSGFQVFEISGAKQSYLASFNSSFAVEIGTNNYFDGSNWKYKTTSQTANLNVDASSATTQLRYAGSGTANTNITWTYPFNVDMANAYVGINETTPDAALTITKNNVPSKGQIKINSSDYAQITAYKSDKTTQVGSIYWDTSGAATGMLIATSGAGGGGGPIIFSPNGVDKWKITTGGNIQAIAANSGIVFNKSGALTNSTLDDYEVGTWTPTVTNGGNTLSGINATYVKIGRMVTATCYCTITAGSAVDFEMGGLPFTSVSSGYSPSIVDIGTYGQTGAYCRVGSGSTTMQFLYPGNAPATSRAALQANKVDGYIIFRCNYIASN